MGQRQACEIVPEAGADCFYTPIAMDAACRPQDEQSRQPELKDDPLTPCIEQEAGAIGTSRFSFPAI